MITTKLSLYVKEEEFKFLEAVSCAYKDTCNHFSSFTFYKKRYNTFILQKMSYAVLIDGFALKAQMAISAHPDIVFRHLHS